MRETLQVSIASLLVVLQSLFSSTHMPLEGLLSQSHARNRIGEAILLSRAGLGYIGIFIFRFMGLHAIALGNIKSSYEYQFTRYHFVRLFDIVLCQIQDVPMLH
jgi:hypothetical protein